MRDVWTSIVQTSGARIYALLVAMATVVLTARFLGPEGRGQLAVITSWAIAFSTLTHLSLGQVALHRASGRSVETWLPEALPALLSWCLIASVVGWLAALLLYAIAGARLFAGIDPPVLALGLAILPLLIWEQYGSSLLLAVDRLSVANRYQVLGRTVTLVGVAAGLVAGRGIASVLVSNALGQLVVALGGLRTLSSNIELKPSRSALSSYLRSGLQLHLNAVGTFLFAYTDVLILNYYAGPRETGYYQLGLQLITVMLVVPQAVSSVFYAKVARLGPDQAWLEQRRVLVQILALIAAGAVAAALAAPWIVSLVAGPDFLPAVEVFRWQLLSLVGMSLSMVMAPQWIGRGFFKLASGITLLIGIANVAMTFWLAPAYGKLGAAWAHVATYLVAIVGNGAFALWCNNAARERRAYS